MKQLHPRATWLFFLNFLVAILFMTIPLWFLLIFFLGPGFSIDFRYASSISFFIIPWITLIILLTILGFIWAQLSYSNYKYELREDGFRKEHGVIRKKYVTIPYERIQNVDIYRGIFARMLGLSDLQIQTAGMSTTVGSYGASSEGRLPGLSPEIAEQLRDELVKRARGKNQGL